MSIEAQHVLNQRNRVGRRGQQRVSAYKSRGTEVVGGTEKLRIGWSLLTQSLHWVWGNKHWS